MHKVPIEIAGISVGVVNDFLALTSDGKADR